MNIEANIEEFFRLATAQDWDALGAMFNVDAKVSQPGSGDMSVDGLMANLRGISAAGIRSSYENVRRVVGSDGVVEQHDVRLVRPDGVEVVVDICVVARFDDAGLIIRMDEYFDSAAIAPLMA